MELTLRSLAEDRADWEAAGYSLPQYDIAAMRAATAARPCWVHFGAGNLFRAFHAALAQRLLNSGAMDRGLIVAEGYDTEILDRVYAPLDNLSIACTLNADGTVGKTVLASVAEALPLDPALPAAYSRLQEIFRQASLQLVTFTITEKGYSLTGADGALLPEAAADFAAGPARPRSYMGKTAALLYARYLAGGAPLALVSTDNCSHNGERLQTALRAFARAWTAGGTAEAGFLPWLDSLSFPWTMIDKITPRPDPAVEAVLRADGVQMPAPAVTAKHTYAAPFVNTEQTEYLVIEDDFPAGRPPLEQAGVLFAGRQTVEQVEKMKVSTCLNPLHTCLAIFGCLLGYQKISDEMRDPELVRLIEIVGYQEGLPAAVDPGILHPREFLDTVLQVRLPNPFLPDTPQRIATDTSQKLAVRFGETIRTYAASETLQTGSLRLIPVVLAGWLRYLTAVDDAGEPFALSPDPLLDTLCPIAAGLRPGMTAEAVEQTVRPILQNEEIFGTDLYAAGLAGPVCAALREMLAGPGAVRQTLKAHLAAAEAV